MSTTQSIALGVPLSSNICVVVVVAAVLVVVVVAVAPDVAPPLLPLMEFVVVAILVTMAQEGVYV